MKSLLLLTLFFASTALAGPWNRAFQDLSLPSQKVLEHDAYKIPIASSATVVMTATSAPTSVITTFTTFTAQPDYPRNILITPGGTTSNVASGTAVVTGLNALGNPITENFTITSTQSTATTGSKAFSKITSVAFPAPSGSGVMVSIGVGNKLGVRRCLDNAGELVFGENNGAFETTRGTMAVDATHVESNTYTPQTAMDGTKRIDVFYVQNFRCY